MTLPELLEKSHVVHTQGNKIDPPIQDGAPTIEKWPDRENKGSCNRCELVNCRARAVAILWDVTHLNIPILWGNTYAETWNWVHCLESTSRTNTFFVCCAQTYRKEGHTSYSQIPSASVSQESSRRFQIVKCACRQYVSEKNWFKYQCSPSSTYLHGHSHCGLLPIVKALCTQCLLEIAEVHLQKLPLVLPSSDSSEDGETEEPKEQASSILQRRRFQVKINCIHPLYHDLRVALLLVPLARSIWVWESFASAH